MTKKYKYIRLSEKNAKNISNLLYAVSKDKRTKFLTRYSANFYMKMIDSKILTPKNRPSAVASHSDRLRSKKEAKQ